MTTPWLRCAAQDRATPGDRLAGVGLAAGGGPRAGRGVPLIQYAQPVSPAAAADECVADLLGKGVQLTVLDAELAHDALGALLAVASQAQLEVFADDAALLGDGGWIGQRPATQQGPRLTEDPRVADTTAGDGDAVHAGLFAHAYNVIGAEQITAAENGLVAGMPFDTGEETPIAGTDVPLGYRPPVHGDGRQTVLAGTVENAEEVAHARRRIVRAAAHFQRDGNLRRHRSTDIPDDLNRGKGIREEKPPAAAAKHLTDRASEIELDHVKATVGYPPGGLGQAGRVGPHELAADGVVFVADIKKLPTGLARLEDHFVEHDFMQGVWGTLSAGDETHWRVAVPGQRRLDDRHVKLYRANLEHAHHYYTIGACAALVRSA